MVANVGKRIIDDSLCDTCNGQFPCVSDCVTSYLITEHDGNSFHVAFKTRGFCIDCGHCNAICPKEAIKLKKEVLTDNQFLLFLASKRTVRSYNKEKKIPKEIKDLIVLAGQCAPSEKNRPTVRICLIKDNLVSIFREALDVLRSKMETDGPLNPQYQYIMDLYEKKEPVLWGAEYAVVIIGKTQFSVDAAIVAERMQLMAFSCGVSSGYNGNMVYAINNSESLKEKLSIRTNESALVCFAMGYSDISYHKPYLKANRTISEL